MLNRVVRFTFLVAVWLLCGSALVAQVNPTGTLTGTVSDQTSAAVVGADITATDDATGTVFQTKSGSDGRFVIAQLSPGSYTVTVTREGFKKGVFRGVKIIVGQTYDLGATLELGAVTATVMVEAGQEVIETQSTTIGTSITGKAITQLPFTSRDTLDLAVLTAGAQTTGRPRQSSFNGLPKGSINITFDGINAQDNVLKSNDGFFTTIRPRVDDVEEFGIATAANGVEQAAEGGVQIRFVSKRGGNAFHGGVWEYLRNDFLNANYYFNGFNGLPRQVQRLNEYGYKVGGPILKDKLFFFTDLDIYSLPQSLTRTRTILTTGASQGLFPYVTSAAFTTTGLPAWMNCGPGFPPGFIGTVPSGTTCTATLLGSPNSLAANSGVPGATNAVDTAVGGLLTGMNSAVSAPGVQLGTAPSLFQRAITFNNTGIGKRYFPDLRLDWNITKNNSFEFNYHYSSFKGSPDFLNGFDQTYPVAPFNQNQGSQNSNRNLFVGAWRTNIGPNKSNEVRLGIQSAPISFFPDLNLSVYPQATTSLGSIRVNPFFPTSLVPNNGSQPLLSFATQGRNSALGQLIETFTWTKGAHNMAFGMSWLEQRLNAFSADQAVATPFLCNFVSATNCTGLATNDPMAGAIGASSLPGSSTADQSNARDLYGLLAGRVNSYSATVYFDPTSRQFRTGQNFLEKVNQREFGFYGTDTWRIRPSLTLTYGLRWEYQGPPQDTLNEFFRVSGDLAGVFGVSGTGNLFKPGTLTGATPTYQLNNRSWWNRDVHDFAPNLGVAWQPGFENNIWKRIFGGAGKSVFRAGYSISYTREGLTNFANLLSPFDNGVSNNPGANGAQSLTAVGPSSCPGGTCPQGQFQAGSLQLQSLNFPNVLQSPTSFTNSFPIDPTAGQAVNVFDPNLRVPRVQSWSGGIQREITPNMVLEVRYVGNHGTGLWRRFNLNEVNIFENGFLPEFLNAQHNLTANGGTSFGNTNPCVGPVLPTCTVALPIMTGAFTGSTTGSQTNSNFMSGTRIGNLNNNLAGSFAAALSGSLTFWNNLKAAGFPSNFWTVNPDARGGAFLFNNSAQSTYNALQVEFRRRPAKGLQFSGNYTFSHSLTNYFANSSVSNSNFDTLRDTRRNKGPAPFDLRHAFKLQAIYELPFGPGRTWSVGSGLLNRLIEGWEFSSITRWQSGRVTQLTGGLGGTLNQNDGGVQLTGITADQLQSQLGIRKTTTPAPGAVFWFPASLLDASQQRANSTFLSACATPGAFCQRLFVRGPQFFRADWSLLKRTRITERVNFELRAEFLNAFNNVNFFYGGNAATTPTTRSLQSTSFGRITDGYQDISTTDDPGGRIIQMVFRVNF